MKRLLVENLGWKLLSLALAVALWLTMVGEPKMATSVSAPVEFRNLPADLEISSEAPMAVRLEVEGSAAQLRGLGGTGVAVVLDLASVYRPGERTFTVAQSNVVAPAGVKLARSVPSQVRLRFERRRSREVSVEVQFAGPPPNGYRIRAQQVQPARLRVAGPESRVEQTESVKTDPIDLATTVAEGEFRVHAYTGDPQVRFESLPVVVVKVSLEKIRNGAP